MGYQMALSLAQAYNPELEANLNAIGSLLFFMGISAFVMMGGPETVLMILARHVRRRSRSGGSPRRDAGRPRARRAHDGTATDIAIRVPVPAIGSSWLMVAMGFIMKTMPQINVMSVGFAVYIVGGLMLMMSPSSRSTTRSGATWT
jgi:flagellar biosynthetic protein FliR